MSDDEIKLVDGLIPTRKFEGHLWIQADVAMELRSNDRAAIDHLKAERDAAVADARRWNELCRQIDAGTFPSVVIEDAMEIGSGALELQVDASMAEGGE